MKHRILFFSLPVLAAFYCASRVNAQEAIPPPLPPLPVPELGVQFPEGVTIQAFARVVLLDVLKVPFVFSSEFLESTAHVGFSAQQLKESGSEALLRDVLREHGFALEKSGGYYRVSKIKPEDDDARIDFVYRLKHRDLAYISSAIQPLFPAGSFTYQRAIDAGPSRQTREPVNTGGAANGPRPVDTGGSLYSMSTRTDSDLLIFRGLPTDVERLQALLEKLDTPVPRVLVRAFVLETASNAQDGYSVSAVARLLSDRLTIDVKNNPSSNSLIFKTGDVNGVASALAGDSSVRVITAPTVFAETGATATLSVGNSVPTLGAIDYRDDRATQSVEYRETGVILRITPRVLESSISLDLVQEISDAVRTETGVDGSPTITKRSLSTVLALESGTWAILGGLSSVKETVLRESLPFFRRFKLARSRTKSKTDIVILLYVERV